LQREGAETRMGTAGITRAIATKRTSKINARRLAASAVRGAAEAAAVAEAAPERALIRMGIAAITRAIATQTT